MFGQSVCQSVRTGMGLGAITEARAAALGAVQCKTLDETCSPTNFVILDLMSAGLGTGPNTGVENFYKVEEPGKKRKRKKGEKRGKKKRKKKISL